MILSLFILMAWISIIVLTILPKALTFSENVFIFLFVTLLVINVMTILDLNLGMIKASLEPERHIAAWVMRNMIIPVTIVTMMNVSLYKINVMKKAVYLLLFLLYLHGIEYVAYLLEIKKYVQWKIMYLDFFAIFYFLCSLLILKGYRKLQAIGGKQVDQA